MYVYTEVLFIYTEVLFTKEKYISFHQKVLISDRDGGKDRQNGQPKWHKLPHMEKQDEGSPICDEVTFASIQYSKTRRQDRARLGI